MWQARGYAVHILGSLRRLKRELQRGGEKKGKNKQNTHTQKREKASGYIKEKIKFQKLTGSQILQAQEKWYYPNQTLTQHGNVMKSKAGIFSEAIDMYVNTIKLGTHSRD